jgi:hypothetical protein
MSSENIASLPTTPREALPKDGEPYARATLEALRVHWAAVRVEEDQIRRLLDEIVATRLWERWPVGQPYGSLDALCMGELGASVSGGPRTRLRRIWQSPNG